MHTFKKIFTHCANRVNALVKTDSIFQLARLGVCNSLWIDQYPYYVFESA